MSVASGFVDFSTGRYSIVTAPGAGSVAQVKVFVFPLMPAIGEKKKEGAGADQCEPGDKKPVVTNAFMPFGMDYRGGLSLATGWLTGPLGGAETIVTGQLAGPGEVKVYSSGSRLDGGPRTYLASAEHTPIATFTEIACLQAIRRRRGRERGDNEHDNRRRPSRQRHGGGQRKRASPEIRVRQALCRSRPGRCERARHRGLRGRRGPKRARRRLSAS